MIKIISFVAGLACSTAQADVLSHIGTHEWPTDAVVGLSGLEVSPDGKTFYAIGDRGWFLSGQFERTGEQIVGVELQTFLPILGNDGLPVSARRVGDWSDAEGLAMATDGTYWISFERWAHVSGYEAPDQPGQWIKDHPSFYDFSDNRQLEALAIDPDGRLFAFSEQPLSEGFPIFRLAENGWTIDGYIQRRNRFAIVGADFDRNGDLYLLERKLVLGMWWQNRIRRLRIDSPDDVEVLWTGDRGEYYNLEGIAVWHDAHGLRITMVSDNNADVDEPTQFVEYRVVQPE